MADEVGEVEEEGVVRGVLVVEDDPAVIDELDLLGQARETVLLGQGVGRVRMRGVLVLDQCSALVLQLLLLNEGSPRIVDDL